MSPWRIAPVTAECIIICLALFVVCTARTWDGTSFGDAQREWGAAAKLQMVVIRGERREVVDSELFGPFDVWDGQWWRIPVSAFHHADVAHLLFNCLSAWALGTRLERKWGSGRLALFLLPSIYLPLLAEFVIGHTAVGFSGAICSMFGALIAIKQFDDDAILPDQAVQFGLTFLVLGVWATVLDLIPIANVAHLAGLAYGWFAAWAMCGPLLSSTAIRTLFLLAHISLYSLTNYAVHPHNNGRYHWYMVDRLPDPRQKTRTLQLAAQCDPTLSGVWLRLAAGEVLQGEVLTAWRTVLEGLSYNPTHRELLAEARRIWRRMPPGIARGQAEQVLQQVFGGRSAEWLSQIKQVTAADSTEPLEEDEEQEVTRRDTDASRFPLDRPINLDWHPETRQHPTPQPFDPQAPGSAVEGTAL